MPHAVSLLRAARLARSAKPFLARGGFKRERCDGCRLVPSHCLCALRPIVPTRAGVCLLMADIEPLKPTNTGWLVADVVADTFAFGWARTEIDPALLALLDDPQWQPYVVFPQEYAPPDRVVHDVASRSADPGNDNDNGNGNGNGADVRRPLFILLDATWTEARKMFRKSPYLDRFPVLSLRPEQLSQYKLRRSHGDTHLCTSEVAALCLGLAGEQGAARALEAYLDVFTHHYLRAKNQLPIVRADEARQTTVASPSLRHSAFYRFVPLADPRAAAEELRAQAHARGLQGSIVVAAEGVSGAVAGEDLAIADFETALQQPELLAGALRGMTFKHSACTTEPFGRLKVGVKPEIVALGLPDASMAPDQDDTSHLAPRQWRALLEREDVVVLDNRNHFEYRLGHFRGAVDPGVHHFRDFIAYIHAQAPAWRAAGRPVAMYCTGGVRCDKTAPWLRSLGLEVWQLDGGVLNYFRSLDDADRDWLGECFVFDNRISLDTQLNETGTAADQVFDATHPDEAWRLARARRLDGA